MKVENTVTVITGGASGLGEATARYLLGNGARGVVLLDMNVERGAALENELGERALFVQTDISDMDGVQHAVDAALERFGAIHAMVAAAAIPGPSKLITRNGPIDMGKFDRVIKVNVYGILHVMRAAVTAMMGNEPNEDGERGVVINVASGAAFEGQIGQIAYSASKAALVGMTMPLARELAAHGVRVVTIAPGAFDTPIYEGVPPEVKAGMVDLVLFPKRLGKPSEFALFVEEIIRNPLHNGRTYRFDGGAILPAKS
ncbi:MULTISPECIES: SDR family NAD(P)-dependent oxidoreductase [Burkholderia cepacia complex]|uniref:SDR family NAD(P)-dependent oxidoreductase n=1 Tax=Burkholderia cepacia complex TaxID=87882 RepID=UPI001CF5B3E8|nr:MULTISPECIES: SDR family NAD(P)-dependent oxidoreductase [Burkholderia cepacia complex]MCA8057351.1 SDR family NAD(P)-dependent oxidoreductase [Burkholderia cepacia]MDN7531336.1 SDR family NAD(P)-dependent oxidoreductase [Burkholderia orbicola]